MSLRTNQIVNCPSAKPDEEDEEEDPAVMHRGVIFPFSKTSEQATVILTLETYDRHKDTFIESSSEMKSDIVTLPSLTKIPPVLAWTSIPYNVHEDDGKFLTNIPFLGDEIIDKDKKFIDEMMNLYEGKVHGLSETSTKKMHMNDDVFFDLVKSLLESEKGEHRLFPDSFMHGNTSEGKRLKNAAGAEGAAARKEAFEERSDNLLFAALSETFKGIGTPDELKER